MPPTSQTSYESQPSAQSGYGPLQAQKPLANPLVYEQTQQSPSTVGSYGQLGYHSQPPSGYGKPETGSLHSQPSSYGATSTQPGYSAPLYEAPPAYQPSYEGSYNTSYGGQGWIYNGGTCPHNHHKKLLIYIYINFSL
ncbi:hypothetical protein PTKIN_Ptkin08bG0032300 [Pterospermum kingtungense]